MFILQLRRKNPILNHSWDQIDVPASTVCLMKHLAPSGDIDYINHFRKGEKLMFFIHLFGNLLDGVKLTTCLVSLGGITSCNSNA